MSHLKYTNYEGFGEWANKNTWYSQAVRIGDIVECSGQGGWDRQTHKIDPDITKEIEQAFENVEHNLKVAGAEGGWSNVYFLRTYHVGLRDDDIKTVVRLLKQYCPDHQPCYTLLGIDKLGLKDMNIEIEVKAHVPPAK